MHTKHFLSAWFILGSIPMGMFKPFPTPPKWVNLLGCFCDRSSFGRGLCVRKKKTASGCIFIPTRLEVKSAKELVRETKFRQVVVSRSQASESSRSQSINEWRTTGKDVEKIKRIRSDGTKNRTKSQRGNFLSLLRLCIIISLKPRPRLFQY